MTLGEMKSEVRRRLNESGTAFYSDADIAASLQEGLDEMADIAEYSEREASVGLLTGRTYYDLQSVLPDTFLSPRRIYNSTTSRWLTPTDPRDQDEHTFVQWELTYGEPVRYLLRGNWWLGVWPRQSNDTGKLRVYYTDIPAPLTDTESPSFPRDFHPGITDYAIFDLLCQQRETEKALTYWKSFLDYADGLMKHVQGRQRIPRRDTL
jgi:hypothetical protein